MAGVTDAHAAMLTRALTPEQSLMFDELVAALEEHGLDLAVSELPDDPGEPKDWEPDSQMVAEVFASPKSFLHMTRLPHPDRAYLVAGLTVRGMTAEEIKDRTHCSLRLIRTIRSWEMTAMCKWVHKQLADMDAAVSGERSSHAHTRRELAEARADNDRLRMQLDQLIDALAAGGKIETFRRCGHPMVPYNVYERGGRRWCRECGRIRKQESRAKTPPLPAVSSPVRTVVHARALASAS